MNIEIYTRDGCSHCENAKAFLNRWNHKFTEYKIHIDVTRDMVLETYPGVKMLPIIVIDGNYIGGYKDLIALLN